MLQFSPPPPTSPRPSLWTQALLIGGWQGAQEPLPFTSPVCGGEGSCSSTQRRSALANGLAPSRATQEGFFSPPSSLSLFISLVARLKEQSGFLVELSSLSRFCTGLEEYTGITRGCDRSPFSRFRDTAWFGHAPSPLDYSHVLLRCFLPSQYIDVKCCREVLVSPSPESAPSMPPSSCEPRSR